MIVNKIVILIFLLLWFGSVLIFGEDTSVADSFEDMAEYVYSRIDVPDLPDTGLYRLGITVDESILADPNLATRKSSSFGPYDIGFNSSGVGGGFGFDARYEVPNPKRSSWFNKRPKILVKGEIGISIGNAPTAKAAFKGIVYRTSIRSAPIETVIWEFDKSCKLDGIGTVGYRCDGGGTIRFVRDNISVVIRGRGVFKSQVLEIARKIDKRLLEKPLLNYAQLLDRCPKVSFRHVRHKVIREKRRTPVKKPDEIFIDVSVPKGRKFAITKRQFDVEGMFFKGHKKIYFDDRRSDTTKPLKAEVTVVSDELLVTSVVRNIEISGGSDE